MISAELFKITRHRTPWVIAATHLALTLIAPVYYIFKRPGLADDYLGTTLAVFSLSAILLSAVIGAWFVGNEYRHGTLRRVVAIDARRGRLLATKAMLGALSITVAYFVNFLLAWGAAWVAATAHSDALGEGVTLREVLGAGVPALVTAALAFVFSVALRSDTYAMLGAISFLIVLGPLMAGIPTIGKYTPYSVTTQISEQVMDATATGPLSLGAAVATLLITFGLLGAGTTRLFLSRDI